MHPSRPLIVILLGLLLTGVAAAQLPTAPAEPSASETDVAAPTTQPAGSDVVHTQAGALIHKLKQGGLTVLVQLLLSVLGLAVVLERMIHLNRRSIAPEGLAQRADQLWRQGKFSEIEAMATRDGSVLGIIIASIVRHRDRDATTLSTITGDIGSRELRRHLQKLYPLAIVATLEPLLGLLGTILGMIGAFDSVALAGSMGDASILANDIAKALVTTAVGLIIAIPALFLYHYLKGRVSILSVQLEEQASELIVDWTGPANATATQIKPAAKPPTTAVAPAPGAPGGPGAPGTKEGN
ncbi:MAG: MotA/TolQ/ExbB proton channel family protein [Phycisphaeraceae bacterium]